MTKVKPVDAVGKIVTVLESLERADRAKVIQAALTLLSESDVPEFSNLSPSVGSSAIRAKNGEKAYFDAKNPRMKTEELATAARYLEEFEDATSYTRADLEQVTRAARRNFDGKNFRRDIDNARKANLFTRGTGRDIVLSSHGQNYVDALPNRDALKQLGKARKPRRRGRGKTGDSAANKLRK